MKKFLKRTILILSCFCIAFSCAHIVKANSVSTMLHADEKSVQTPDLEILVNPVNYYFTTGVTCKYDVTFVIEKRSSPEYASLPIEDGVIVLPKDSSKEGAISINSNYALVSIYGDTTSNPKKGCIAGALLYDSSRSSIQNEIDRINAEVE